MLFRDVHTYYATAVRLNVVLEVIEMKSKRTLASVKGHAGVADNDFRGRR